MEKHFWSSKEEIKKSTISFDLLYSQFNTYNIRKHTAIARETYFDFIRENPILKKMIPPQPIETHPLGFFLPQ
jgi:hypothetical protein